MCHNMKIKNQNSLSGEDPPINENKLPHALHRFQQRKFARVSWTLHLLSLSTSYVLRKFIFRRSLVKENSFSPLLRGQPSYMRKLFFFYLCGCICYVYLTFGWEYKHRTRIFAYYVIYYSLGSKEVTSTFLFCRG